MYSENGVLVDFGEINDLISNADVFVAAFANFPERLIVDTRGNEVEAPLVQIVDPARSAQERSAWLQRRRPSLGAPEGFSFFPWPHSPSLLVTSGIWDRIRRSVGADIEPEVSTQCDLALRQLQNLDTAASMAAIQGEGFLTLWPPQTDN